MPVPDQRDPEVTRTVLARWLTERLPGGDVTVSGLRIPQTTGFSAETLLFDAECGDRTERLVAKVAPVRYQVFPDPLPYADQYRLLRILDERTGVPVPRMRWYEGDATLLGAPFFVIDQVDGLAPEDNPPYHGSGWVAEADPERRRRMWTAGLEILAEVHRLAPEPFAFLDRRKYGPAGLRQRLGYYAHYMGWAYHGPQPTCLEALRWLRENRPPEPDPPVLLWGDSRIGNILYGDDGAPRAVLDWEIATLGAPEEDLAWFMFLDRHHSEGIGVPRLPGFPSYADTVAFYEELTRRPMRHMAYYEVLSAFKFAVIMARVGQAFIDFGLVPPDSDFPVDNTASRLLAGLLDLPAPGPTTAPPSGDPR
ncbi:phosphotransferase family protein [Actinoallomurus purpureus]|uniref:phosphotransferase family protein n=1 Tax=Actinoallomurus purpureus TaxID=478114 RepID=UPI0020935CD2|nr:phosphotransferase family protein [Actinoallomurus purpureus]MCO6006038.1 phosphotransferase family protein [Actinoallomurus purpureus]